MIERAHDRFGLWPERLAADTGYGSAEMLGWLVHEKGIEPHVPVFDQSRELTAPSAVPTSPTMLAATSTPVQAARRCATQRSAAKVKRPADGLYDIVLARVTASDVISSSRCCPAGTASEGPSIHP